MYLYFFEIGLLMTMILIESRKLPNVRKHTLMQSNGQSFCLFFLQLLLKLNCFLNKVWKLDNQHNDLIRFIMVLVADRGAKAMKKIWNVILSVFFFFFSFYKIKIKFKKQLLQNSVILILLSKTTKLFNLKQVLIHNIIHSIL